MKKLIPFLFAVILLLSCGGKTGKVVSDTDSLTIGSVADTGVDKHSEAYIRQRIDTIYKGVGKPTYDSEGREVDYIHNPFNRDSAYCSQRYYALKKEALQICDETGDILYDFDYWVCGQDYSDDWSCSVADVYEITDSSAYVDLNIHNFGDRETTIALRFERGDWYIDDFCPSADGYDDKYYLRETIRQGLLTREKAKTLVGYWGWVGDGCPELLLRLEMGDKGLTVTECNIYRLYGFDNAKAAFNGSILYVDELEYDEEAMETKWEFHLHLKLNDQGDLTGDCRIRHPLASKDYDGPITLRKDYFKYRDEVRRNSPVLSLEK
ncbi:MAG: DUF3828 domain-containing protein [Prevotella sp.]|nr:DUF3828 domain-containing protein [Prevotella sp.]